MTTSTAPPNTHAPPADPCLLAAVRRGDTHAYGQLYLRHRDAARRLAGVLARDPSDADDVVAEAFAKVFAVLRRGGGPDLAFRPYLLAAVRHAWYDRTRAQRRLELTDDMQRYEQPAHSDPAEDQLERAYAARAFARLPERWRMVLWHTEVEGERPARIAPLLGLTPNAVAALAYRARERLRQMYLQEHLTGTHRSSCRWTASRLGAYVRGGLPRTERRRVENHLATCPDCRTLQRELSEVNSGLRAAIGPLMLGGDARPYLAATAPTPLAAWLGRSADRLADLLRPVRLAAGTTAQAAWQRLRAARSLAAVASVAAAVLVAAVLFGAVVAIEPDRAPAPTAVAPPGVPVPAPAPATADAAPGTPEATATAPPPATAPPAGTVTGRIVPRQPSPASGGAPAGLVSAAGPEGAPAPDQPRSLPAIRIALAQAGTALPGARTDDLRLAITLPEHRPAPAEVAVRVGWPPGMGLHPDHRDGDDPWRCAALPDEPGARCERPAWPAGESRTVRLALAAEDSFAGLAPVTAAATADPLRGQARFHVPVAPAGAQVTHAITGRYDLAMAGNTWLTCQPRPDCRQDADNHYLNLVPYLPEHDPQPPGGLTTAEPMAASGARLAAGGDLVAWAGLHWATTADHGPQTVIVAPPGGHWRTLAADQVSSGGGRPLWQGYADITDLVRQAPAGDWWLAAPAADLPRRLPNGSAGWSITVVFADGDQPERDVAIFTGAATISDDHPLVLAAGGPDRRTEVGLVLWEGDRTLTGDRLRLAGQPLGEPDNLAASRAAGALECGAMPVTDCDWHTFGVDVGRYGGPGGTLTLHAGDDLVEFGVVGIAIPTLG